MADKQPKRKRRTYSGVEKADAMGQLAASATDDGPCFRAVGRAVGIDQRVLRRWWAKSKDRPHVAAAGRTASHARAKAAEDGAALWLQNKRAQLQQKADDLMAAKWVRIYTDTNGQEQEAAVDPSNQARAMKTMAELFKDYDSRILPRQDDNEVESLEAAIKRAKL